MNNEHVFISVEKNDGGWKSQSAEGRAIDRAFMSYHEAGLWDWEAFLIEKLECDNRDKDDPNSHYPDLCWHYKITIYPPKEETDA